MVSFQRRCSSLGGSVGYHAMRIMASSNQETTQLDGFWYNHGPEGQSGPIATSVLQCLYQSGRVLLDGVERYFTMLLR